jgi:CRISPR-associated protein Cmr4
MSEAALLVLRAHTGIHAGVGQEVGTVDLPIQRERITNFPVIRGSSLKGALRQAMTDKLGDEGKQIVTYLFGPETMGREGAEAEHAGALSVGDARLLLFPMRSLVGTFAWLTCPFVLERLNRDLVDGGLSGSCNLGTIPKPPGGQSLVCATSGVRHEVRQGQKIMHMVVVENYGIDILPTEDLTPTVTSLGRLPGLGEAELKQRTALLEDDLYKNLVSFGTEVVTRIRLDDAKKTVERGALWTEELLPAETVLTALVVCVDSRDGKRTVKAKELLDSLCSKITGRFQIGGKETVGYGACHAEWLRVSTQNKGGK